MSSLNSIEKLLNNVKTPSIIKDLLYANQREVVEELNKMLRVFAISLEEITELTKLFPALQSYLNKDALLCINTDSKKLLDYNPFLQRSE